MHRILKVLQNDAPPLVPRTLKSVQAMSVSLYVPDVDALLTLPKAKESAHDFHLLPGLKAPKYLPHPDMPYPLPQKACQSHVLTLHFYSR